MPDLQGIWKPLMALMNPPVFLGVGLAVVLFVIFGAWQTELAAKIFELPA